MAINGCNLPQRLHLNYATEMVKMSKLECVVQKKADFQLPFEFRVCSMMGHEEPYSCEHLSTCVFEAYKSRFYTNITRCFIEWYGKTNKPRICISQQ